MPRVSAIIIVYNGAPFVGTAIESVLAQTERDLELVVVDDGSTDETAQVVARYTDHRVRYLHQENSGPSAARNNGIRETTGEWVAFLDCDDRWLPRKLELQLARAAERPDAGLVYGSVVMGNERGMMQCTLPAVIEGEVLEPLLFGNKVTGSASSAMVRRDVLDRVGMFDERMHYAEDWDLWLRVASAYPFAKVDEPIAYLLQRLGSHGSSADALRDASVALLDRAFNSYASNHRRLQERALAEVYFRSAIDHHSAKARTAAGRDLLQTLRRNPLHLLAYRPLVRLAIPI